MLDQESLVIDQFKGLFDRGELRDLNVTQIPPGFFKTLNNYYHQGESLVSRPGFTPAVTFPVGGGAGGGQGKKIRHWPYRLPSTNADRFLLLQDVGGTRKIVDQTGQIDLYQLSGTNDFQFFINRTVAYGAEIATTAGTQQPLGITARNTKIYNFSGVAADFRDAAGLSPSAGAGITAATSATAGVVEAGVHLIAVAYETSTGFITPPGVFVGGVYTPTQYTAPGAFKIDLSVIPTGPAGTVARHILASKVIRPPFNGDVLVPELFFVPGGKINDNTTTTLTIDFYDTSLVVSADYLLDELETIPSGTCYCTYNNRLVIVGFNTSSTGTIKGAPSPDAYVARVSNPGQFESFSAIEGFIQCFPNDGDALQACWELNGNLYLAKGNRTYVARDNGGPPNTWPVDLVDAAIGCGPYGVAKIDNTQHSLIEGGVIVGSRRGIYYFNGQYSTIPLTYNIEALYRRNVQALTNYVDFFYSKFYYDSYRRLLYWLPVNNDGTNVGSQYIMVGTCDNGLSPEAIRWSTFNAFNSRDGSSPNRYVRDIYTTTLSARNNTLNALLTMLMDDGSTVVTPGNLDNKNIQALRSNLSLDQQEDQTGVLPPGIGYKGGIIDWELVSFPAKVEELDKLQVIGARALMKHDNTADPIDFLFQGFDYTYNEFLPLDAKPTFFGDNAFPPLRDMVLLPQLYDAPLNLRSKLAGISLARGIRGGNIDTSTTLGDITNTVFIHKLMFFGNRAAQGKSQGSIR